MTKTVMFNDYVSQLADNGQDASEALTVTFDESDDSEVRTIYLDEEAPADGVASGGERLPWLERHGTGERLRLVCPVLLGRGSASTAKVGGNLTVSRRHALIECVDGRYFITDHSTNGTSVDGRRIPRRQRVELRDGCEVMLSNERLTFHVGG